MAHQNLVSLMEIRVLGFGQPVFHVSYGKKGHGQVEHHLMERRCRKEGFKGLASQSFMFLMERRGLAS